MIGTTLGHYSIVDLFELGDTGAWSAAVP